MGQKTGGSRKIGRNKKNCERYRLEGRKEKAKKRRADKWLADRERWANDRAYQAKQEKRRER